MANLLDIRRRIKSVKNTQQITKAMKMVSAAKLKRAQDRVLAARPYALKMSEVLASLASRTDESFAHPLMSARDDKRYLLVLVTSDKGLCGGFNANLQRAAQSFQREHADKEISLVTVGRKGRDFFRRRGASIVEEYVGLTSKDRVEYSEAIEVARSIIKRFSEDETLDKVFIIFSEFKSALQQRVVTQQLLPIASLRPQGIQGTEAVATEQVGESQADAPTAASTEYLYEQPAAEIFSRLLPRYVETQIYRALLESVASEQGSRMTAMDSASKNAGELINALTLNMNRIRQAAITKEIIEVVSGAAAL
ncbi:MAG: ATP synthase F1 subunit gamma [Pyrinomonadaceae bacterium]